MARWRQAQGRPTAPGDPGDLITPADLAAPVQGPAAAYSGGAGRPRSLRALFLHLNLLPLLGLPIGELFQLDALAAGCAAAGTWDFLFTSASLKG